MLCLHNSLAQQMSRTKEPSILWTMTGDRGKALWRSLALLAAACGIVTLLLLLTIVITWEDSGWNYGHSPHFKQGSAAVAGKYCTFLRARFEYLLFLAHIIFLGLCLFGNEHINRGVTKSLNGLADVNRGFKLAIAQLVMQVDTVLTYITDGMDTVRDKLNMLQKTLTEVSFLESAEIYGERIELERIGSSVLTFCLLSLGLFLFTLLVIVSRSWNLFTRLYTNHVRYRPVRYDTTSEAAMYYRVPTTITQDSLTAWQCAQHNSIDDTKRVSFRPSDYVEVDEDDPFFPRTNDSMIPVDIYGTHVFNPRTSSARSPYNENSYGNYMNNRYDV
ncbi:unnamed protein product [Strongylus vulgaris]|uniref:Protein tweety homolog n=1 Tax=Strongylus vulgaris TaxID=40348 RepID=A0A3P7INE7_STRVU|nr:unnamed protein product [Strongylus vulgaris]